MSEPVDQPAPAASSRTSQPIERIILANARPDVPAERLAGVAEAGRLLLSAIPGVEHMSFSITQDDHTTYGADKWLPIIVDQIVIDYDLQYG